MSAATCRRWARRPFASLVTVTLIVATVSVATLTSPPAVAQTTPAERSAATAHAWTLDEALEQLRNFPDDAYLQYVVLQLAGDSERSDEAVSMIQRLRRRAERRQRRPEVEAFGLFSGALAIQESLQLERLTSGTGIVPTSPEQSTVPIDRLQGPTIRSHPWQDMLAGRDPSVSRLSQSVPQDYFFVEAKALTKLLDLSDLGDLWGRHFATQAAGQARTQLAIPRVLEQLSVKTTDPLRPLYDSIVGRVAITGSDLFLREGSDVTLLFEIKEPAPFRARMELFLVESQTAHPNATRSTGSYLDVSYVHLATPDRRVHVYSAYPREDLHVRSNSLVALERVIATIRGRDASGRKVASLGDSDEFRYMRTLMPLDDEPEDVLVYLSDPFIRRLVGPQLKLTELRRMYCYNHLRMIGHAGLMFQTQYGRPAQSLNELVRTGCAPEDFSSGGLNCPDGGAYQLQADGLDAVCTHHGHAELLKPCCEIPVQSVSEAEAEAYRRFLQQYSSFWRTFFDPIAIRVQLAPEQYRVETIILPLIDNSIYTALSLILGGEPQPLEARRVPARNIFSAAVQINKVALAHQFGMGDLLTAEQREQSAAAEASAALTGAAQNLRTLAVAMFNYHDAFKSFPPASRQNTQTSAQLSWRVHVLPFLGDQERKLYEEFHLDEPWDSPHNRKLISRIPDVFRPIDAKLAAAGKTQLVLPVARETVAPDVGQSVQIRQIVDGTSNTVLIVEADPEHAVVWTQPADLRIDLREPLRDIAFRDSGAMLAVMADGRVVLIRRSAAERKLTALLTRDGRETVTLEAADQIAMNLPSRRRSSPFPAAIDRLEAGRLLLEGIGDHVSLHLYDNDPLLSVSMPMLLGEMAREVSRGGIDDDFLVIGALLASITAPVYVEIPVQNDQIVDAFLERLETELAHIARGTDTGGFIPVTQDFYRWQLKDGHPAWSFALMIGPIKARVYWARVGETVCISSKRYVLEDLLAAPAVSATAQQRESSTGHAMLRLRPRHWDQVLNTFQLGWSEGHRLACHENLGPLANLSRAAQAGSGSHAERSLTDLSERIYDAHFYCPEGGQYHVTDDGKHVHCSVHGSVQSPRQPTHLGPQSAFSQLLEELGQVTLTLSFLEDGLRAVVTVERE